MLRCTRRVLYDSYRAARGDVRAALTSARTAADVARAVRLCALPLTYRLRRLPRAAQRSWLRGGVLLLLREARALRRADVALATLSLALREGAALQLTIEPAWLKDVVATCTTPDERQQLHALLRKHSDDNDNDNNDKDDDSTRRWRYGNLLAMTLGSSSNSNTSLSSSSSLLRLSAASRDDDDKDAHALTPSHRDDDGEVRTLDGAAAEQALQQQYEQQQQEQQQQQQQEARVAAALAQQAPLSTGVALTSPAQRALYGMRLLQQQRETHDALAAASSPSQAFVRYFLTQGLVRSERELVALFRAMRTRRAYVCFRVHTSHMYAHAATAVLRSCRGIAPIAWLPPSFGAYTLDCSGGGSSSSSSHYHSDMNDGSSGGERAAAMTLQSNRQLLQSLADERVVSFQSITSMLPVLALSPRAGERVLDLCAAPGSKSALLLDCMRADMTRHAHAQHVCSSSLSKCCDGCVVANESHFARVEELRVRLRNTAPQVVVTRLRGECYGDDDDNNNNNSSGYYTRTLLGDTSSSSSLTTTTRHGSLQAHDATSSLPSLQLPCVYDKVLVDAPCSGEGRMERDALQWRLWHPRRALDYVPRQLALLRRALQLCRVGGVVVYATCTLNPLENEAVVAATLRALWPCVELVTPDDSSYAAQLWSSSSQQQQAHNTDADACAQSVLPPLRLSNGLASWLVPSREGGFYRTRAEAVARGEGNVLPRELFAPGMSDDDGGGDNDNDGHKHAVVSSTRARERAIAQQLQQCCRRVLPHHNHAAEGFFVATLRIVRALSCDAHTAANSSIGMHTQGNDASDVLLSSSLRDTRAGNEHAAAAAVGNYGRSNDNNGRRHGNGLWSRVSLLHARGLVRLPATNHTVQQHLGGFFRDADALPRPPSRPHDDDSTSGNSSSTLTRCRSVHDFLTRTSTDAVWSAHEGLRLVATAAVAAVRALPSVAASTNNNNNNMTTTRTSRVVPSGALRDMGVLAVDATGALTEAGAVLLSGYASARVLRLPLRQLQLLLAHERLELSARVAAAEAAALRRMYTLPRDSSTLDRTRGDDDHSGDTSNNGDAADATRVPAWLRACLRELCMPTAAQPHSQRSNSSSTTTRRVVPGNAIVVVATAATPSSSLYGDNDAAVAALLRAWALPVYAEQQQQLVLHTSNNSNNDDGDATVAAMLRLLLSPEARHRCLAMLGRVRAALQRGGGGARATRATQLRRLHAAHAYDVSAHMSSESLYGNAVSADAQTRALLSSSSSQVARRDTTHLIEL